MYDVGASNMHKFMYVHLGEGGLQTWMCRDSSMAKRKRHVLSKDKNERGGDAENFCVAIPWTKDEQQQQ